jgi:hypothetical protein
MGETSRGSAVLVQGGRAAICLFATLIGIETGPTDTA